MRLRMPATTPTASTVCDSRILNVAHRGASAQVAENTLAAARRAIDRTGEFTAEVPTSATGHLRFFAGEGEWTLRTLAPKADTVDKKVVATIGSVAEITISI